MSDDSDKTVFNSGRSNPGGGEHTKMRPMPGGRPGGPQPGAKQANPGGGRSQMRPPPPGGNPSFFKSMSGLNPLVNAAAPLIAVLDKSRGSMTHPDVGGFYKSLAQEIREFDNKMRDLNIAPEIQLAARYSICAVIDDIVLNTPWGRQSAWAQRTLLNYFHNETSGGEKFFLILNRMMQAPADNLNMIELMYICLSLGFEGKYRLHSRGRDEIEKIRDELFIVIRRYRGDFERSLCDHWHGLGTTGRKLTEFIPMWVIAAGVASILAFSFGGFKWWLHKSSSPVATHLGEITEIAETKMAEDREQKLNFNR